jgi:hypothetical protein
METAGIVESTLAIFMGLTSLRRLTQLRPLNGRKPRRGSFVSNADKSTMLTILDWYLKEMLSNLPSDQIEFSAMKGAGR